MGVVTKAGPWYSYQDAKVMGMNGLKNYFLENPVALDELKNAVSP